VPLQLHRNLKGESEILTARNFGPEAMRFPPLDVRFIENQNNGYLAFNKAFFLLNVAN
jgi:hypothetical protein